MATADCWERFCGYFAERGYPVSAPHLPGRKGIPAPGGSSLGQISLADYTRYCADILDSCPEPPIVIGHSMGGLIAQMLAARTNIRAAVLLTPSAPSGILMASPSGVWAFRGMLLTPGFWNRPVKIRFREAVFALYQRIPREQRLGAYKSLTADSGRVLFEMTLWFFDKTKASHVDASHVRCPLCIVAAGRDRLVPPGVVRRIARKYRATGEYQVFPENTHYLIAEPGWEQVAAGVCGWLESKLA